MKSNWWLNAQTLASTALATRAWPVVTTLQKTETWPTAEELGVSRLPPLTVIVPARNEERCIERCVRSLLLQTYPDYEVIAVDDGSTDSTPSILAQLAAEFPRLKVVRLEGTLPEKWSGKVHAMYNGVAAANPESVWYLFTDADTMHAPAALERAVARAIFERADLLTAISQLELGSFWEKLLMPIAAVGISLQYPLSKVNSPHSKIAVANGQFLLLRKRAYEQVGGWETLKNSILDDRDMAILVKKSGAKLFMRDGRQLLKVRMYTSLSEIWNGWSKNAFAGSRGAFVVVPFFIVVGLVLGVLPFLQLPYAALRWLLGKSNPESREKARRLMWHSGYQVGIILVSRRRLDSSLKISPVYSLCTPLGVFVFMGILVNSMWRALRGGGVVWKGRSYDPLKSTTLIR